MKQRINKSLPYPLLSQDTDDYVGSTFSQSIEASRKGSNLSILLAVSLDDAAVETLLISGCATVAYHIECAQTGYRKVVYSDLEPRYISISFTELRGVLDINTFVIAKDNITQFRSEHFNEDYENLTFDLEAGCRIAEAPIFSIEIPKKYTDLTEKNDPYVIVIPNNSEPEKEEAIVNLSGEKIMMIVHPSTSSKYSILQQTISIRPLLHDMFILPALFQGLMYLKTLDEIGLEEARARLWVQSIEEDLKDGFHLSLEELRDKELVDIYSIAQQLLNNPLFSGTNYLANQSGGIVDED